MERLYGGLEPALRRALTAVGTAWDPRAGAAQRRFAALAAANVARPGQILVVSDERLQDFLAPLPLELVPMEPRRRAELHELGVKRVGQLAGLPGGAVAERLGPDGRRAWGLARGGKAGRVRGRRPPAEIVEALEFPEAIGNELTLRRAFGALVETLMARPERGNRFVRKLALSARLVGGGSWRRSATLRDPTTELDRIKAALGPKLSELPAPVLELRLELVELTRARRAAARALAGCRGRAGRSAYGRACARCAPAPARARSTRSWRSHRGRAFRKLARCSCRGTIKRAAGGGRRGPRRRNAGAGESPSRSSSSARSGVWWIGGGRRSRCPGATSRSCLQSGENAVVFRDEEKACWFTQRGA